MPTCISESVLVHHHPQPNAKRQSNEYEMISRSEKKPDWVHDLTHDTSYQTSNAGLKQIIRLHSLQNAQLSISKKHIHMTYNNLGSFKPRSKPAHQSNTSSKFLLTSTNFFPISSPSNIRAHESHVIPNMTSGWLLFPNLALAL